MSTPPADPTMTAITDAVTLARAGRTSDARASLEELWGEVGPGGDPLHRCTLAHYLADLYDSAEASLEWDLRALAAADELDDQRVQEHHASLHIRGFYPSLHLNLADDYRRLGDFDSAAGHLTAARSYSDALTADGYGAGVLGGIDNVAAAIATRSTERLATH
ncbi:hypothetical protein ACIBED_06890 [Rhodococcus coprophilus]|uniref:Tetratricopeptide repeat protein n=1 Tax=Rhodococcus coprophilus TaxID=38310 RepID=A0A2X4UGS6_9NOCA|nr:hypothetical protein [Rhodococcus coprophilus]MBM7459997.1 hypothetical protein [Rhodococcus coprophilus]SQI37859.1 Uncharacterised protein [Rhodococcus coprophilus]